MRRTINDMITMLLLLAGLLTVALLAPRFGADTRDGCDWRTCS